jgi:hypothetical protein
LTAQRLIHAEYAFVLWVHLAALHIARENARDKAGLVGRLKRLTTIQDQLNACLSHHLPKFRSFFDIGLKYVGVGKNDRLSVPLEKRRSA